MTHFDYRNTNKAVYCF